MPPLQRIEWDHPRGSAVIDIVKQQQLQSDCVASINAEIDSVVTECCPEGIAFANLDVICHASVILLLLRRPEQIGAGKEGILRFRAGLRVVPYP